MTPPANPSPAANPPPAAASSPRAKPRWNLRSPVFVGGALTVAGFICYDISTYFYLGTPMVAFAMLVFFAGLAALLLAALHWAWHAGASELAAVGIVLILGYVMATVSPTVFAPPAMQGGEADLFRRTPLVLALIGALLLLAAGARHLAARRDGGKRT